MRLILTLFLICVPLGLFAQEQKHVNIESVEITSQKLARECGLSSTKVDSLLLRENIAMSLSDVLIASSALFIKQSGRASLSTVALRGTAPSHTQVIWNGIRINSPMMGQTDFSMIPSFLVDKATILYGASSLSETTGGIGGAIKLETQMDVNRGVDLSYIQGIGSYLTFDEFLKVGYSSERFSTSTKISMSTSRNDFKFKNHDYKENVYDENHNIIYQYYPRMRNRNGAFRDFHLLHEMEYRSGVKNRLYIKAWYTNSYRELPMLTSSSLEENRYENFSRENTLRMVAGWKHINKRSMQELSLGYIYSSLAYNYRRDPGTGQMLWMTHSLSALNSVFAKARTQHTIQRNLTVEAQASIYGQMVRSENLQTAAVRIGYDKQRAEIELLGNIRYNIQERFYATLSLNGQMYKNRFSPIMPALFLEGILQKSWDVRLKCSVARNCHAPSINDLYFLPGGNPNLLEERSLSEEIGISFSKRIQKGHVFSLGLTAFHSLIKNWIEWLPTFKGFLSPSNMGRVRAYGIEAFSRLSFAFKKDLTFILEGNFAYTPSLQLKDNVQKEDLSFNKQVPFVPKKTAAVNLSILFREWSFAYRWNYYSERYTMSSNDIGISGVLPSYFMSNISIGRNLHLRKADILFKCLVNNLLNEDYQTIPSYPMPGINFEIFLGITPKWHN
ncbi:MAG: TonB-dependent receptor [Alistipes sp.]|nr:TonB-dependent receptor [Candidatus Alistipes equi]